MLICCSSSFCSPLQYYCCFRWFIVCRVKSCFLSDKLNNRSASAAQSQDRLNPTQQSVSKSVSQPLHQLSGQLEKSTRQLGRVTTLRAAADLTCLHLSAAVFGSSSPSLCSLFFGVFLEIFLSHLCVCVRVRVSFGGWC